MADKTTIEITTETWSRLNARKRGPSDSFEDVLGRLLDATDGDQTVTPPDWDDVQARHDLADDELEAAKAVWDFLAGHGGLALKSDVIEHVMAKHPTGKTSEDNWWRSIVTELADDVWSKFHAGGIKLT